jgi:antitoxin HicB
MTSQELEQTSNEDLRIDEYPFIVGVLSAEDGGGYLIEYPDVPGCISEGETAEEAIHNGKDALRAVLLTKLEFGEPIPVPGSSSPLPIPSALRSRLEESASRRGVSTRDLAAEILSDALTKEPAA